MVKQYSLASVMFGAFCSHWKKKTIKKLIVELIEFLAVAKSEQVQHSFIDRHQICVMFLGFYFGTV